MVAWSGDKDHQQQPQDVWQGGCCCACRRVHGRCPAHVLHLPANLVVMLQAVTLPWTYLWDWLL
jgi:hypothetical protein